MYHALLSNRYLTTRVIPFIAIAAVGLCVALVIIVVSVMTGFLDMVKDSGRTLIGDVVVSHAVSGFSHYDELIERLEALPEVEAASPAIDTFGLIRMPYPFGSRKDSKPVQVWGIEPESFARVTGYDDALYWRPLLEEERASVRPDDPRLNMKEQILEDGRTLIDSRSGDPGIALGMHVSIGNVRQEDGSYRAEFDGYWWMPDHEITLTLVPVDSSGGTLQPESRVFPIVNEFMTGVFMIDQNRVVIPLAIAQSMLEMDEAMLANPDDLTDVRVDPARASMVLVRAVDGVTPEQLKDVIAAEYDAFYASFSEARMRGDASPPPRSGTESPSGVLIETWLEKQRDFIAPIEKERTLMQTLFQIIYLVCAGLVLSIFWSIVYEKTRDIGILRASGASRAGICWIFLRYGLFIGVLGSIVGLGVATAVVHNINEIHDAMGDPPSWIGILLLSLAALTFVFTLFQIRKGQLLPLVLGGLILITFSTMGSFVLFFPGVVIWDPSVYYFTVIPNTVDLNTAFFTMGGAVAFCLLGAFIPAARAADVDPVRALRYE